MIIYIVLVAIILVLPKIKGIDKKKYCIIVGTLMTAIVGFRSIHMGMSDTKEIYVSIFDQLSNMSIKESYEFIVRSDIEVVFYMFMKIYQLFIGNIRLFIILTSIPLNFTVARLIYKYSKLPSLSFIMFFSLNYFAFSFTLIRHCIALAILIISYDFLKQKKFWKFAITVFIAGLFHRTALIFLIAYPLVYLKSNLKLNFSIIGIALIFACTLGEKVLKLAFSIIESRRYMMYSNPQTNTLTFFAINLVILLFVILFVPNYIRKKEADLLINLTTVGICMASCMIFISEAFRISTFFTIYSIVLLPNAVHLLLKKEKQNITQNDNLQEKTYMDRITNVIINVNSFLHKEKVKKLIIIGIYTTFIIYFFGFTMHNNEIYPYLIGNYK